MAGHISEPTTPPLTPSSLEVDSSLKETPFACMDIEVRDNWSDQVYPDVFTKVTWKKMEEMLYSSNNRPQFQFSAPPDTIATAKPDEGGGPYCHYLNSLSEEFRSKNAQVEYTVKFISLEDKVLDDNASDTSWKYAVPKTCHPDIVAIREYPSEKPSGSPSFWSHFEAIGVASPDRKGDPNAHTAAYVVHHLSARPDYVSTLGILVRPSSFKLFFVNSCRVYRTSGIKWGDAHVAPRVLLAWFWRLYHPEVESSITPNYGMNPPTFDVDVAGFRLIHNVTILFTGDPFDRRTTIMKSVDPDTGSTIVIKEQYLYVGDVAKEGHILDKIHSTGCFPGIIRVLAHGSVLNGGQEVIVRHERPSKDYAERKVRIVLGDSGEGFMKAKTPKEALMVMYDLLEVTRVLYREKKILHRDISCRNVLVRSEAVVLDDCAQAEGMYFSEYLLNKALDKPSVSPLSTRLLLIDFEMADDQSPDVEPDRASKSRAGTPMFEAGPVRSTSKPRAHVFPPMPEVAPGLQESYRNTVSDRVEVFPPNEAEYLSRKDAEGVVVEEKPFRHLLRFDAESVFWVLNWWCIRAKPKRELREEPISQSVWNNFTSASGYRWITKGEYFGYLHSAYKPLSDLLYDIGEHVDGDLGWAKEGGRDKTEYLHEVIQRLILNFLFVHWDAAFINEEKSDEKREQADNWYYRRERYRRDKESYQSSEEECAESPTKKQRTE
ncbi:hypothetical protein M408DRAFT_27546 [Serendipita vermifera MAFF 305830]|uniref:Fungal-type protein kinase domain-containing protein n=1 Tax=Serendipita vermifera MAFF 305830 TaxID=933852 RepID=A0A0C3AX58_SERVB|nr:hypothetical protein M408DRAFT_27546 [Serendipita vermifera MAFF 305830]